MKEILKRRWWLLLLLLVVLLAGGGVVWASQASPPMPEALAALEPDARVEVSTEEWLVFRPANGQPEVGLILYPGGRVDPRAYAPAARALAEQGYLVVIVPMPFNLAVLAPERAGEVIAAYEGIERWAIGGHSLGGAMAARYAYEHPEQVEGLVLWGAYPAETNDLSGRDLDVVSIYGTRDGLASVEEMRVSRALLPETTTWIAIEGGNHAQFGWYGDQSGDNAATIGRVEQQEQVVEGTLALLSDL